MDNKTKYEAMLTKAEDIASCLLDMEGGHIVLTFAYALLQGFLEKENPDSADAVINELCYMTEVPLEISEGRDMAERLCWHQLFMEVSATKLLAP